MSDTQTIPIVDLGPYLAGEAGALERTARELRPGLKVLLTSGYLGDVRAELAGEFPLIDKPYERAHLAAKLRELCDAPPPSASETAAIADQA